LFKSRWVFLLQRDCKSRPFAGGGISFATFAFNRQMFYRQTARVLLACYGVIALAGQGLHEFLDD
jgi:hypothetical protein